MQSRPSHCQQHKHVSPPETELVTPIVNGAARAAHCAYSFPHSYVCPVCLDGGFDESVGTIAELVAYRNIVSHFASWLCHIKDESVGGWIAGKLGMTEEGRVIVVIRHEQALGVKTHQEPFAFPVWPHNIICWEAIVNLHSRP